MADISAEKTEFIRELSQHLFRSKSGLLEFIRQQLNIKIPSGYSYLDITELLIKREMEHVLWHKLFSAGDYEEARQRFEIWKGLAVFSREELLKIADDLSNSQRSWPYRRSTKLYLMDSIYRNITKEQLAQCLERLILKKELSLPIRQYEDCIVGPLGITRSTSKKHGQLSDKIVFLLRHIDYYAYLALADLAGLPREAVFEKNDPLLSEKQIQTILTFIEEQNLVKLLNQLIGDGRIQVKSVESYGNMLATPCGIFERASNSVETLAQLLLTEFTETDLEAQLTREGYNKGNLRLRVLEKCVKVNPNTILSDLAGFPALRKISQNLGLVGFDRIRERSELIDMILLKLGFQIPPHLAGIGAYQEKLKNYAKQLESVELQPEQRVGIMTSVYVESEAILKDIIYFYTAILWRQKVGVEFETEAKKKAADAVLRDVFKLEKEASDLPFGLLVSVLRKMNEIVTRDEQLKKVMREDFNRPQVILKEHLQTLDEISPFRSSFTHDKKTREVDLKTCEEVVTRMIELAGDLEAKGIYPHLIRVTKEVTNEYGVTYLEATEEKGKNWILKPEEWVMPGPAYFMLSETNPIAVHPIMTRKFW